MSEKDQFNTQAEPIFRQIVQVQSDAALPDSVGIGIIADALRKQAWVNDAVYQGMQKEIAALQAYKDTHEGVIAKEGTDDCPYCQQEKEIADLRAENEKLRADIAELNQAITDACKDRTTRDKQFTPRVSAK